MNIGIGEHVRTKNGDIAIFRGYNERETSQWIYKLEFQKRKFPKYCAEGYITNHGKEIIDLIETGDYVNGQRVIKVSNVSGWIDTKEDIVYKDHIKSIVTKEQFNNMEYRV